jgi:rhamnogalacturonyl hydrolase YesR
MTDTSLYSDDQTAQITQLQQQQGLFTQALKAAVEGRWVGAGSVEAFLYALDPGLQGTVTPDPPVTDSEYEAPDDPKA